MSKKKVFDPVMIGLMFNFLKNLYTVSRIKSKKSSKEVLILMGLILLSQGIRTCYISTYLTF
jgi:hypothetical protein